MIDKILEERGARYGKFKNHAVICQDLKTVMRVTPSWRKCTPSQQQALETIADKIARILNGDPSYDDNWIDIIGYSQLVLNELHEHEGQTRMEFDAKSFAEAAKEYVTGEHGPLNLSDGTFAEHRKRQDLPKVDPTESDYVTFDDHEAGDQ